MSHHHQPSHGHVSLGFAKTVSSQYGVHMPAYLAVRHGGRNTVV